MLTLDDPDFDNISRDYYADMLDLVARLVAGTITAAVYQEQQVALTEVAMVAVLVTTGAELTNLELAAIFEAHLQQARESAASLAEDVVGGRYTEGLTTSALREIADALKKRIGLWTYTLGQLYSRAILYVGNDGDLMQWQRGATEAGCESCVGLDGQIKTRAEWRTLASEGTAPRSKSLACGGWNCDCKVVKVS